MTNAHHIPRHPTRRIPPSPSNDAFPKPIASPASQMLYGTLLDARPRPKPEPTPAVNDPDQAEPDYPPS